MKTLLYRIGRAASQLSNRYPKITLGIIAVLFACIAHSFGGNEGRPGDGEACVVVLGHCA